MNFENKYYVSNDHIVERIRLLRETEDKKLLASIIKQLTYLVQSKIKGYRNKNIYNDLLQEGKIGLIKAIKDFDENRGPNFFKFACWHIQYRIRLCFNWDKKSRKEIKSEDIYSENFADSPQEIFEKLETKFIILNELNKLPEMDRKVLIMRFGIYDTDNFSFKEIGEKVSLSKQRIDQIEKRALRKLKNNEEIQKTREM